MASFTVGNLYMVDLLPETSALEHDELKDSPEKAIHVV